jgi:hypothetical protein
MFALFAFKADKFANFTFQKLGHVCPTHVRDFLSSDPQ